MNPETILLTIKAVSEAVSEGCKLAQTPAGQALIMEGIKDRVAAKQFFEGAGKWITDLFAGKLGT